MTETHEKPPRKPPGRNGYRYQPQHGIIVICPDEAAQAKAFARLSGMGYKLKVVCV